MTITPDRQDRDAPPPAGAPATTAATGPPPAATPPAPTPEPGRREARLVALEAAARARTAALADALAAIESSASWRLTAPLRRAEQGLPAPLRHAVLALARAAYRALTPHRIAARRRWIAYEPVLRAAVTRLEMRSAAVRERSGGLGSGGLERCAYGDSAVEQLDIYPAPTAPAPIFVFVHGGAWREGDARNYAFPAGMFGAAGAHYVAPDFLSIREAGNDVAPMVEQVRRAIAWVYRNAARFGGDPERLYIGGHSSGAHLCAVALATDWRQEFGLPDDIVKGALLMSGIFDLRPLRGVPGFPHFRFDAATERAMSPALRPAAVKAPVTITCGSRDTPEFRRQSHAFHAALRAAGRPAELFETAQFGHMEMLESLGDPSGANGRAALALMGLAAPPAAAAACPDPGGLNKI